MGLRIAFYFVRFHYDQNCRATGTRDRRTLFVLYSGVLFIHYLVGCADMLDYSLVDIGLSRGITGASSDEYVLLLFPLVTSQHGPQLQKRFSFIIELESSS